VEDRPVARFLALVITDYNHKLQDKGTDGKGSHMLLPDFEVLDMGRSQDDWHES
jgi:hypothetical protein